MAWLFLGLEFLAMSRGPVAPLPKELRAREGARFSVLF